MYLKRLEIQGFKSFASKTTLDFIPPADGRFSITAVVGPNGSGKSNISDAIRWVMGEQSLKVLRGKKSEDVIFGGSENKGQLGAAEVTLVLDNLDAKVLADYSEISITRRLFRSGEGEYLVNNNPVRLFDIHLLLAQAQFGQHSYSVVGQGMIDRLLTVGPGERKDFLDEASGIKEFQIKRHQAGLKLARTKDNMEQAERLLAEVEPRLRLLNRQMRKLEKRQEIELTLRESESSYYYTIYSRNQRELEDINSHLATVETGYRGAFRVLEKIQNELAELARSSTRQEVFQKLQNRYNEAIHLKNEVEKQLAILEGQMHTEYNQTGKQNMGWLEGKVKELNIQLESIGGEFFLANGEAVRLAASVHEEKLKIENLSMDKTQIALKITRLQNEMIKDQSEQNYLQLSGLTAVKAVLEAKSKFGQVHGLVAELAEVKEEYRIALEVAAGQYLSAIVVADETVARKAIVYLREHKFGTATFLPLNKIQGRALFADIAELSANQRTLGLAVGLAEFDQKFKEIFSFIFGSTLVVKNLRDAEIIGIGRARMVTLEGDLVEKNSVMKGGSRHQRSRLSFSSKLQMTIAGRLGEYQTEINLEQRNLSELEVKLEQVKSRLLELSVKAESAAAQASRLNIEKDKVEKELVALQRELAIVSSSPEEFGEELKRLAKTKIKMVQLLQQRAAEVEVVDKEMTEFNVKEEEKNRRVFALQNEMQTEQTMVNTIMTERNDLKISFAKLETKQEDLAQEIYNEMKISVPILLDNHPRETEPHKLEWLAAEIQKLKYQLSLIGGIDEEVTKEYGETKERCDFLSGQLEDLYKATEDLTTMIVDLDELMKKKRATAFKKIRKEFDRYFKILFGGGNASLEEIYGEPEVEGSMLGPDGQISPSLGEGVADQFLDREKAEAIAKLKSKEKILTGIEVLVNPPGKKIRHINSLSGGERTLTSIALICAILNCNPSPFVVLDEVEAALDEANTGRFVRIMAELSAHSQFIIITHNRVTMHAADALYGVVMKGDGVSNILSVKIEEAEEYEDHVGVDKKK